MANWEESKHPRDGDGKFTYSGDRHKDHKVYDALQNRGFVNEALRDGPLKKGNPYHPHMKTLDKLASRPAPRDLDLYSKIGPEQAKNVRDTFTPGKVINDKGYQVGYADHRKLFVNGGQAYVKIKAPKGTEGVHFAETDQIMLHRGAKLRYDGESKMSRSGVPVFKFTSISK